MVTGMMWKIWRKSWYLIKVSMYLYNRSCEIPKVKPRPQAGNGDYTRGGPGDKATLRI